MTNGPLSIKPLVATNMACTAALMALVAVIGPAARILGLPGWQVGAVLTAGGVLWMLLARPWGVLSDRLGRRKTLLIGVGGFVLSYWAMCAILACSLGSTTPAWIVFLGLLCTRGVAGAFYAALPTVGQALIADHLPPAQRTGALAAVGAANGMGLVLGPAVAAILTHVDLVLPLVATAVMPLLAFLLLGRSLPHSAPLIAQDGPRVRLTDPRLRSALTTAFVAMLCVYISQVNVGFFAVDRLGLAPDSAARAASSALAAVGIALIAAQLAVRRYRWPSRRLVRVGALISAAGFGGIPFAATTTQLVLGYLVAAAGMGLLFPSFAALASNAVQAHEQGAAAGSVGAAQGLGIVVGPLIGTLLYEVGPGVPYAFACVLLMLVAAGSGRDPCEVSP
ncbi:MAG: MFS transporter [Burkholderiaceae bacterium]